MAVSIPPYQRTTVRVYSSRESCRISSLAQVALTSVLDRTPPAPVLGLRSAPNIVPLQSPRCRSVSPSRSLQFLPASLTKAASTSGRSLSPETLRGRHQPTRLPHQSQSVVEVASLSPTGETTGTESPALALQASVDHAAAAEAAAEAALKRAEEAEAKVEILAQQLQTFQKVFEQRQQDPREGAQTCSEESSPNSNLQTALQNAGTPSLCRPTTTLTKVERSSRSRHVLCGEDTPCPTQVGRNVSFEEPASQARLRGHSIGRDHPNIEELARNDPFLSYENQRARQAALGLDRGKVSKFLKEVEIVSLGCFCAVAHSLRALGVKRFSYPFDWNRSPMSGVIRCLEDRFADFLSYSFSREDKTGMCYGDSKWGGSFWHHDATDPKTMEDFSRRIDRFLGKREVPMTTPRVFVRAVNTTQELHDTLRLRSALRRALPQSKHFLLMLIDLQDSKELLRIAGSQGEDLLFGRIHSGIFANRAANWTIEAHSEAYAEAIAQALRSWSGFDKQEIREVSCLQQLINVCDQFDGGNPGNQLFFPQYVKDGKHVDVPGPMPMTITGARWNSTISPSSSPQGTNASCPPKFSSWSSLSSNQSAPTSPAGSVRLSSPPSALADSPNGSTTGAALSRGRLGCPLQGIMSDSSALDRIPEREDESSKRMVGMLQRLEELGGVEQQALVLKQRLREMNGDKAEKEHHLQELFGVEQKALDLQRFLGNFRDMESVEDRCSSVEHSCRAHTERGSTTSNDPAVRRPASRQPPPAEEKTRRSLSSGSASPAANPEELHLSARSVSPSRPGSGAKLDAVRSKSPGMSRTLSAAGSANIKGPRLSNGGRPLGRHSSIKSTSPKESRSKSNLQRRS